MADEGEVHQFEVVLDELRPLVGDFMAIGVPTVLIGGQVLAVEARASGGSGIIEVRTPNDVVVTRGFSMERDLLFDIDEAGPRADAILDVLKARGFNRAKTARWHKNVGGVPVFLDLFMPAGANDENNPGGFIAAQDGDLALVRSRSVRVDVPSGSLDIAVPDPVAFLAMKAGAKLRLRPTLTKDSFDIYAYVMLKGATDVGLALQAAGADGERVCGELVMLFGSEQADGVRDIIEIGATLNDDDQALLRRSILDVFEEVRTSFIAGR